jgi:CrcB protein
MDKILIIGAGGFVGAAARYGTYLAMERWLGRDFPFGTLAVNLVGCFAIGALAFALQSKRPEWHFLLVTGVLGAYTTFSAFGHETWAMLARQAWGPALLNAAANLVGGVAAVALGRAAVAP